MQPANLQRATCTYEFLSFARNRTAGSQPWVAAPPTEGQLKDLSTSSNHIHQHGQSYEPGGRLFNSNLTPALCNKSNYDDDMMNALPNNTDVH